jgi:hypothetical protein
MEYGNIQYAAVVASRIKEIIEFKKNIARYGAHVIIPYERTSEKLILGGQRRHNSSMADPKHEIAADTIEKSDRVILDNIVASCDSALDLLTKYLDDIGIERKNNGAAKI